MDAAAQSLVDWLLSEGRLRKSVAELQQDFALQLTAHLPVERLWFGTTVLHPQAAAYLWIWTPEGGSRMRELSYALFESMGSVDSPLRRLRLGAPFVRWQRHLEPDPDLSDIADLWAAGFQDFYGLSVLFRGDWIGGLTVATRRQGGFTESEVALLDAVRPTLSAVIEPLARDQMYATLLRTYLGEDAGGRVSAGQVRRGDQQHLRAVVWFSDVRGFTRLSVELDGAALLDLLNDVFEVVVEGLQTHGGQVLKFVGDGVLAVFPVADGDQAACEAASRAADDVQRRLAALREHRDARGLSTADVGIGMHLGDVAYGNVGAPGRLDFTVIGSAVNLSARVEGLCGRLGRQILASDAVASQASGWVRVGSYAVKGVVEEVVVFTRGGLPDVPLAGRPPE